MKFNKNNYFLSDIDFTVDNVSNVAKEVSANVILKYDDREYFYLPEAFGGYTNMFVKFSVHNGKGVITFEFSNSECNSFIEQLLYKRYFDYEEKTEFAISLLKMLYCDEQLKNDINKADIDVTNLVKALSNYIEVSERKQIKKHTKMYNNKQPKIINIFGGPGTGKSTLALELTAELKKLDYNADYVSEVAKEYVYSSDTDILKSESLSAQLNLLQKQKAKLDLCIKGGLDYIVVDSPLLLNLAYFNDKNISDNAKQYYQNYVYRIFKRYNNINFLILRGNRLYNRQGRIQTKDDAINKDIIIAELLRQYGIKTTSITNDVSIDDIIDYIK